RIDDGALVDSLSRFGRVPLDAPYWVGWQALQLHGVVERVVEHGALAADGLCGGRLAVEPECERVQCAACRRGGEQIGQRQRGVFDPLERVSDAGGPVGFGTA